MAARTAYRRAPETWAALGGGRRWHVSPLRLAGVGFVALGGLLTYAAAGMPRARLIGFEFDALLQGVVAATFLGVPLMALGMGLAGWTSGRRKRRTVAAFAALLIAPQLWLPLEEAQFAVRVEEDPTARHSMQRAFPFVLTTLVHSQPDPVYGDPGGTWVYRD